MDDPSPINFRKADISFGTGDERDIVKNSRNNDKPFVLVNEILNFDYNTYTK